MDINCDKNVIDHKIAEQAINWLVSKTNRSNGQTRFLYEILGSWPLLLELEEAIKMMFIFYCPGDLGEALYIIGLYRVHKSMGWIKEDWYYKRYRLI